MSEQVKVQNPLENLKKKIEMNEQKLQGVSDKILLLGIEKQNLEQKLERQKRALIFEEAR